MGRGGKEDQRFMSKARFACAMGLCFVWSSWCMGAPVPPGPEIHSEFIFEHAPFQSCHASTLVETAEGDFLAAWFGGTHEGASDVAIWMSRLSAGKWSLPTKAAFEPGVPSWNPVLFRGKDNRIWLFYKFGPSPDTWTGAYKISSDGGKSWSDPVYLPAGMLGPIKDKPIQLFNGDIVAGTSVESYHSWSGWIERSTDEGKTWTKHGPIVIPHEPFGLIQPALVELRPQQLRLFARSRQGFIYTADSADGGRTWTNARPTSLPNPNSGIDCVRLKGGRILMVYNNTSSGRSPLNVATSPDGGETWAPLADLETGPGEFSYPAVIQAANGDVHITYTWKRERIKHALIPAKALR
jgi:predicted neuraminidase